MPRRPTRREIAEEDRLMLARQAAFRRAADAITAAFAKAPEVRAVTLFGSVARPLTRNVPRFQPLHAFGIEILHECKDVDLAVWIDRLDGLDGLRRASSRALNGLFADGGPGVAHHQADIFLFEPGSDRYLGRLCGYAQCPKGKSDCLAPGCGRAPFLKQHEGFSLNSDALAPDRTVPLFDRAAGILRLAAGLDVGTL